MKKITTILAVAIIFSTNLLQAQLRSTPHCPQFNIDILEGSVSKMYPQSPFGDIVNRLPCYTEAVDELTSSLFISVYFKDKFIFFHTYLYYIYIK